MAAMASYGHFSNTPPNCCFFNTNSTQSADISAIPSAPKTINNLIYIEKNHWHYYCYLSLGASNINHLRENL